MYRYLVVESDQQGGGILNICMLKVHEGDPVPVSHRSETIILHFHAN